MKRRLCGKNRTVYPGGKVISWSTSGAVLSNNSSDGRISGSHLFPFDFFEGLEEVVDDEFKFIPV
jgi:hypothetical protein